MYYETLGELKAGEELVLGPKEPLRPDTQEDLHTSGEFFLAIINIFLFISKDFSCKISGKHVKSHWIRNLLEILR